MNKCNFIFASTLLLVSSHTVLASATISTDVSSIQTRSRIDHAGGGAGGRSGFSGSFGHGYGGGYSGGHSGGGRYSNNVDAIKTDIREETAKNKAEKAEKEKREKENNKKDGKK